MIYDTLVHIEEYRGLSPQMDLALDILKNTDFATAVPGKYIMEQWLPHSILAWDAYFARLSYMQ